jgi:pilus assembly protein FimV
MIASTAGAASLGRLAVLSAIGEPLRAEIELSVSPEELDSASPRLASIDDYAAAGLTYNPALNGARLSVQYRENGRRVIHLMTMRPVNEPVIALMVEVTMRGGRNSRAYNVLLGPATDAPVRAVASAPAAPVVAAAPVEKPVPAVKPAAEAKPVTAAKPAAPAAKAPRAEKTRAAVAAPPVKAAAPADDAAYDRELNRLASQITAGDKIIKDMLSRVTVMEGQVAQLQKAFAALPTPDAGKAGSEKPAVEKPVVEKAVVEKAVVEKAPAEKPAAEKPAAGPAPVIADPTKPVAPSAAPVMQEVQGQTTTRIDTVPRNPHKSDRMLNLALLILACGALALFIGLGYVMLGRRRAAKIAEAEAAIAAEAQNAA